MAIAAMTKATTMAEMTIAGMTTEQMMVATMVATRRIR
jgi:hypothetical protein